MAYTRTEEELREYSNEKKPEYKGYMIQKRRACFEGIYVGEGKDSEQFAEAPPDPPPLPAEPAADIANYKDDDVFIIYIWRPMTTKLASTSLDQMENTTRIPELFRRYFLDFRLRIWHSQHAAYIFLTYK